MAFCRVKVAAEFKEERKKIAARRDEDLKRVEDHYKKTFAAAESRRDEHLRKINEVYADKMVEVQTTREREHARSRRRPRPPDGRAPVDGRDRLPQARRKVQGIQGTHRLRV